MQYYYEIELQITKRYTCVARYIYINQYNIYTIMYCFEEKSTDDHDCGNQIIVVAIISVLSAVVVVCIVGLTVRNIE